MTDLPHTRVEGKHGASGFELAPEVLNRHEDVLTFLRTRRSTVARDITAPGPDDRQLDHIMQAATRVPDHGKLTPWHFVILRDAGKDAFTQALAARWRTLNPDADADDDAVPEVSFLQQSPLVVVVISSPLEHPKIPQWEQQLSAGAVCLNLLNAALASGFAAQWRTGWPSYDEEAARLLRLTAHERIAGFIHIGTHRADAPALTDRRRPFWRDLASEYPASGDEVA